MDRHSWAGTRRGLVVAVVAGAVGFLAGGGAPVSGPAHAGESPPAPTYLNADPGTTAPYSDAVRTGSTLYLAGNLGLGKDGKIVPGGITAESEQMLENLKAVLDRNGSSLDRVVSCLVLLADIGDRDAFNEVYKKYWSPGRFPARSAFGNAALYLGAKVEISCTAVVR
jgi:2-iminobutanoate/2-iminopropanoate deaminase